MLKYRIALLIVLIGCLAIMACSRSQDALMQVMDDPEDEMMDMMSMIMTMKADPMTESVDLPAPTMTVMEAAEAMNAAGTGAAHGTGIRTVYFNAAAAMTNKSEGAKMYPAGSMIVKDVMNDDNTEIVHVATMLKTDDPMYMDRGGWIYGVGGANLPIEGSVGCDECHAKAGEGNDYVFVSLLGMTEEGMEGMTEEGESMNGNGGTTNGNGDGNGA